MVLFTSLFDGLSEYGISLKTRDWIKLPESDLRILSSAFNNKPVCNIIHVNLAFNKVTFLIDRNIYPVN